MNIIKYKMSSLSRRQLRSSSKFSRKRNYRAPQKLTPLVGGKTQFEALNPSPSLNAQPDNEVAGQNGNTVQPPVNSANEGALEGVAASERTNNESGSFQVVGNPANNLNSVPGVGTNNDVSPDNIATSVNEPPVSNEGAAGNEGVAGNEGPNPVNNAAAEKVLNNQAGNEARAAFEAVNAAANELINQDAADADAEQLEQERLAQEEEEEEAAREAAEREEEERLEKEAANAAAAEEAAAVEPQTGSNETNPDKILGDVQQPESTLKKPPKQVSNSLISNESNEKPPQYPDSLNPYKASANNEGTSIAPEGVGTTPPVSTLPTLEEVTNKILATEKNIRTKGIEIKAQEALLEAMNSNNERLQEETDKLNEMRQDLEKLNKELTDLNKSKDTLAESELPPLEEVQGQAASYNPYASAVSKPDNAQKPEEAQGVSTLPANPFNSPEDEVSSVVSAKQIEIADKEREVTEQSVLVDKLNPLDENYQAETAKLNEMRETLDTLNKDLADLTKSQGEQKSETESPSFGDVFKKPLTPKPEEKVLPFSNNEGEEEGEEEATASDHIQRLIDSCTQLKDNYENKHREVLLLGEIITAMKAEFDKLKDFKMNENDCTMELAQLREQMQKQTQADRELVEGALQALEEKLADKHAEQQAVLEQAGKNINNLITHKEQLKNSATEIGEFRKLQTEAEKLAEYHRKKTAPEAAKTSGVKPAKKSRKKKPAKKPRKKSGHRASKGTKRSKVSGKRMIKITRRRDRESSTA